MEVLASVRRDNATFFAVVLKAKPVVDSKIWDDGPQSAGAFRAVRARVKAAAKEALELRRRNIELKERLKNIKAKTDVDISDEAAGAARITMAADSKARKAAEAKALSEQNAKNAARVRSLPGRARDSRGATAAWADELPAPLFARVAGY